MDELSNKTRPAARVGQRVLLLRLFRICPMQTPLCKHQTVAVYLQSQSRSEVILRRLTLYIAMLPRSTAEAHLGSSVCAAVCHSCGLRVPVCEVCMPL